MNVNFGSNKNIVKEFLNIDILPFKGVNLVCDCEKPLPFKNNSFDGAYSHTFLEHLSNVKEFMVEVARVCKNDSLVHMIVPYCRGNGAFGLDHKTFFHERTFECFYQENTEPIDLDDTKPYVLDDIHLEFGRFHLLQWVLWKLNFFWCGGALHVKLRVNK